jgi:mercuric ion binding protein
MNQKLNLYTLCILFIGLFAIAAQTKTPKLQTVSFTVEGCCKQCKERIESALDVPGIRYAVWDKETKKVEVTFATKKLSLDAIHQIISAAGHDTDRMQASDAVYAKLPGCCQYRGGSKCAH